MITNETIDEQVQKAISRKKELGEGLVERTDEEKDLMQGLLEQL